MGCRRILSLLDGHGVSIVRHVATGGLAQNHFFRQVLADVLQVPIAIHPATNGPAVGAAIYGAAAAGVFGEGGMRAAVEAMARVPGPEDVIQPNRALAAQYDAAFERYMVLARPSEAELKMTKSARRSDGPASGNRLATAEGDLDEKAPPP